VISYNHTFHRRKGEKGDKRKTKGAKEQERERGGEREGKREIH
jgi:hypothetical protein